MEQDENITNAKIMEAIVNLTNNLNKNTESVEQILNSIEDIKTQQNEIKKDLLSFKTNTQASIKALEANQQDVVKSQEHLNKEVEDCKSTCDSLEERAKTAELKVVQLNAELHTINETLNKQKEDLNDLQQYGRRNMIEISNIPKRTNENLKLVIEAIAKSMNLNNFNYADSVDVAHRLKSELPIPPIIVMFKNRTARNEFYEKRKLMKNVTLKDLGLGFNDDQYSNYSIFINESLTLQNAVLFRKVRQECKNKNFKFFWTTNGKIMCKKNTNSSVITIKKEEDIGKFIE